MRKWAGALAIVAATAACGTEEPVSIGTGLVPIDVNTFEVVLPSERFLVEAKDFGGYVIPGQAGFGTVGTNVEGSVNIHTIARFLPPPTFIEYTDSLGEFYYDEFNPFISGRIVVRIDTVRSPLDAAFDIDVYLVDEEWHQASANWTMRVDTLGEQVPWAAPGAAGGDLVSTATWFPIEDTVVFPVDSQTIRLLTDTLSANHGVMFVAKSLGSRVRFSQVSLRIDAPGVYWPDSVYVLSTGLEAATFLVEAETEQGQLKVGGVPTWRSFLRFTDGLDTLTVCGGIPERCGTLAEADINYAALVVQPVTVPGGFLPEDTLDIEAREVIHSGLFPIERSPVGNLLTPASKAAVPFEPAWFMEDATPTTVEIPITRYIAALTRTPSPENPRPGNYMTLMSAPEAATFGYGAVAPPDEGIMQLRLIVSFGSEMDNP